MEEIIIKIQKLLNLASNNPNENEAIAAALKAQEMMAKYNIEVEQLESKPQTKEITEAMYCASDKHDMKKWRFSLSGLVANNFRCKSYVHNSQDIVFYGYKEDVKIALSVFKFLYETGNRLAVRYYNQCKKEGRETKGVMNTYLMGFRNGIASVLEKQCVALMIVTPQDVKESFEKMSKGWGTHKASIRTTGDTAAYEAGKRSGKDVAMARYLS